MSELKKCPFCGDTPEVRSVIPNSFHYRRQQRKVYFVAHRCSVLREREVMTKDFDTEEEAAATWNRRSDGWISVNELPKKTGYYLTCRKRGVNDDGIIRGLLYFDGECFTYHNNIATYGVTHWMPLPESPEEADHVS
jgi:hypothetical protein